ncbi:unnamed protein product [Arabidopsis halleri]
MATCASTSSSTSSALTEVVAQLRVEMRRTISPYDLTSDGTIPQPTEDDADFEDWTANNALVISWIHLTIDESLTSSLSHINDSNELWIHVQKRFGVKNGQCVQRLKTELANCRQKDEEAKQLSRDNEGRADGVSFAVQITSSRKPFDNRAVCTICGLTSHISDNCFRKIGYPDWWGENSKSNSNFRNKQGNNSGKGNSNYGGAGRGTTTTSIGSLMGKNSTPSHANSVFASNSSGSQHFGLTTSMSQTSPLTAADRVGISGLSNDQWQTLVNILEERKARNTNHQSEFPFAIVAPSPPPLSSSLSPPASMEDRDLLSQYDFVNDTVPPSSVLLQETPVTVTTQSADTPETSTQTETVFVFSNPTPAAKDSETVTTHTEKEIETENNISTDPHQLLSKTSNDNDPLSSLTSQVDETEPEKEKLGFGYRKKNPPVRLADYVTSLVYTPAPSETPYPLDNFISSSQFSDKYQAYLFAITSGHEPQHYNEAILDEN